MDAEVVDDKDLMIKNQKEQIKNQQKHIEDLTKSVELLHEAFEAKKKSNPVVQPQQRKIPNFLSPVHPQHLKDLEGLRMKCNGNPGGDCLSSCTTMHISFTKDKS